MIRFALRFLGLVTLAAAFVFFVYDGVRFIANQKLEFTSVGEAWTSVHQNSLIMLQAAVEHRGADWLWPSLIQPYLLRQPAWLVLLIVGAILVLLGRRKKPLIGYAR
jgi:hypothetical protein